MNRIIAVFMYLSVIGLFFLTSCINDDDSLSSCDQVTGPVITETRAVDDFHSILLQGIGNIFLTQGATQSLRIETHEGVLDILETTVVNELLRIDLERCLNGSLDKLDIFVTIPDIRRLEVVGVGTITGQNSFDTDELNLGLTGVGDIIISGTTDFLGITSSGVGNVNAFEMIAETCDVLVSGVGNVEVTVNSELNVIITGAGNVSYKGQPTTINQDIEGLGKLINAN